MRSFYKYFLLLPILVYCTTVFSQADFDQQIKKLSDTLSNRLARTGKTRLTVSNFVDLQGNTSELGKYIAESFSVELSNKQELTVVDRSRLKDLLKELNMTEEKLTRPENALKLGEMAGVEYIITGTIVPLEKTVDITIKALDIQKGTSIAGQRASVPRTDAISNLMNSNVSGDNTTAANVNAGKKIDVKNKSAADVIFETGITDMRKVECEQQNGTSSRVFTYGQACFENQTEYDLVLTIPFAENFPNMKVLIPKGGRNCWPRQIVNRYNMETTVSDVSYTFTTTDTSPKKKGTFVMTLEKCKVKSIVLTKKNLALSIN